MCGIAGILDRSGAQPDARLLEAMRDVMAPRGPDDAGLHTAPGIGLAHRRLSIVDLSSAGHQPMPNEDRTVWLVFNGEIYNFAELRPELESAGHRFRSQTDTEVVLHAYEQWGTEGMLARIHGMFALAIWDEPKRQLLLARDRLGKKPLFFADLDEQVLFASDLKSIWLAARDRLTVDPRAVDEFLYFYFVTANRSIYQQIKKVPPAGFLEFRPRGTRHGTFWRARYDEPERRDRTEWLERCDVALRDAVARRMVSDVPLGAFLSGGVDSGLVVAYMSQASRRPVRTFTVGMAVQGYDERAHARAVAERYQTEHHELQVEPKVWESLPDLVWQYGEPFGDSSAVPTSIVARMARQQITVALSGDGGDEAFAGYPSYAAMHRGERWWWLPRWTRRHLLSRAGAALHARWPEWRFGQRLRSFTDYMSGDPLRPLNRDMGWGVRRQALYSPDMQRQLGTWDPARACAGLLADGGWSTPEEGWRLLVLTMLLPGDYLVKVDVASMMSSLEVRCPFLDTNVVELTSRIPLRTLLGPANRPKSLLKELALRHLPPDTVTRPKRGFELPISAWLRGPWNKALRGLILSDRALGRGYFRREALERTLALHARGLDQQHRLWCVLWLELWHLMFEDRVLKPGDALPLS